jgi:hypothetical protein
VILVIVVIVVIVASSVFTKKGRCVNRVLGIIRL